MSKSKVAPSEQLSMVIDPHRHLSHFGAEGRACPEGPRGRSPRSAPVAPGSAAAHNACLDQMPGGPLGEPTQQLRSVHILPSTRQQLLDLQGRGHPFEFGARRAGARRLGLRRWLDDESPARAFEHIAATTNRELAFLNKGPKTLGDQLGVPVARLYGLYGCLSGEPLGKRPLADIFTDGPIAVRSACGVGPSSERARQYSSMMLA